MIAAIAFTSLATSAMAIDLGNGLTFDNTFKTKYSVENSEFETSYKGKLKYAVTDEVNVFAKGYVDLDETAFEKLEVGVEYQPVAFKAVKVKGYVVTDESLQYSDTVIEAQFKF